MTPPLSGERVLSTLERDGTRRWLRPRPARGRFLRRRRVVGYLLIALFVALPLIEVGGRPALLLDVTGPELAVLGAVFRPSDGYLMMLLGIALVLAIALVTALFGRVWCGWGCPQTVYLELVFRPIERWLEGSAAHQARLTRLHPRRLAKWAIYGALAFALANVFLAYFVGAARLREWVVDSPLAHPGGFLVVVGVAALVWFDFGYFREQTCMVACPYGRLQAVLLDRQSLIVGYDARRGEPRGKPGRRLPVIGERAGPGERGDCVDCAACVAVCPTGIDIRDGLQMECTGCAQCIDACDHVMDRLGRRRGLIGYTSEDVLAGRPRRLVRPRTLIYPALLVAAGGLLAWGIARGPAAEVAVERITGPSFFELPDGRISSQLRIRLDNESAAPRRYTFSLLDAPDAVLRSQPSWRVEPRRSTSVPVLVDVPRASFRGGKRTLYLRIVDDAGFHSVVQTTLLGPDAGDSPDAGDAGAAGAGR